MGKDKRGFTLVEALIIIAIILILVAMNPSHRHHHRATERSKAARAKADMRYIAKGLEAYFADYQAYPPAKAQFFLPEILTTPIAYMPHNQLIDPFTVRDKTTNTQQPLSYYSTGEGWLLFSIGPNQQLDMDPAAFLTWDLTRRAEIARTTPVEDRYNAATEYNLGNEIRYYKAFGEAAGPLLDLLYDPTNGTGSAGDIIRTDERQH